MFNLFGQRFPILNLQPDRREKARDSRFAGAGARAAAAAYSR
jgi:hypothetical protein